MTRLVRGLLRLVEETVSGRVGGVTAERTADVDRSTVKGTLRTLELAMPLVSADVAVVLLPEKEQKWGGGKGKGSRVGGKVGT